MNPFKFEPVYIQRFPSNTLVAKRLRIEKFCGIPFMNNKRKWSYKKYYDFQRSRVKSMGGG